MKKPIFDPHSTTIAQRGQIVQRVIVDGWTSAQAAASFGLPRRAVDAWVADFRKSGMASLRRDPSQTIAAEFVRATLERPLRVMSRRLSLRLRRVFLTDAEVQPLPLRRSHKDGSD